MVRSFLGIGRFFKVFFFVLFCSSLLIFYLVTQRTKLIGFVPVSLSLSLHLARSVLLGNITLICPLLEGHFDTGPDSKMGNNAYPDPDHDPNHVKKMKNMLFTLNIL